MCVIGYQTLRFNSKKIEGFFFLDFSCLLFILDEKGCGTGRRQQKVGKTDVRWGKNFQEILGDTKYNLAHKKRLALII